MTVQQPYTSIAYGQQDHQRSGAWQEHTISQGQRPPPLTTHNLDYPQHEDPVEDEFEKMFGNECKFECKASSVLVALMVRSAANRRS